MENLYFSYTCIQRFDLLLIYHYYIFGFSLQLCILLQASLLIERIVKVRMVNFKFKQYKNVKFIKAENGMKQVSIQLK